MPTFQRPRAAASASSRSRACSTTCSPGEQTKPAFVPKDEPETGTLIAPGTCPARSRRTGARRARSRRRRRRAPAGSAGRGDPRAAVQRDDALGRRRLRRRDRRGDEDELLHVAVRSALVRLALLADRRRPLAAHVAAAQRACDVTGIHLYVVAECGEPLERMEEILCALARGDREIGSRGVADEERVAGQHELRRRRRTSSAPAGGPACAARGSRPRRRRSRRRRRAARTGTRARRVSESRPAARARARTGRDPTRGRRACASRARARSTPQRLRRSGTARSRARGRRRPRRPRRCRRRGTRRSRGRRPRTA